MNDTGGWIGVDLDGTLAYYDGWKGAEYIGDPIPAMVSRVQGWLAQGQEVRIMTARVYREWIDRDGLPGENERIIQAWCLKHIGENLPVTCCKDYTMIELWDDRAVRVEMNTGKVASTQS